MLDSHVVLVVPASLAAKIGSGVRCEFEDLTTATPKLLIEGRRYEGHFEDILGTDMAFETVAAIGESPTRNAGLKATCSKRLVFSENVVI
jgi:TFIIIC subunit triple barrel domain